MGPRPGIGGTAILVPSYSQQQLAEHPPEDHPVFEHKVLVEGRAQCIQIESGKWNSAVRILNVHNHELSHDDRSAIRRAWLANAEWAHQNELERLAVAIGDFNISDSPSDSLLFPEARQARLSRES
eukprot:9487865-Pyramimonas_sp.AAC.2